MYTKYNIIIIGCGGTGGNFIKELGRYLYENSIKNKCRILLVDGDLVEEKNIARQPFLPQDVGRKKSEVMAEILQEAFNINCEYYTEYIDYSAQLKAFEISDYMTILVGCVDNHACRKVMQEYYKSCSSCYYLDAANEFSVGEVVAAMRMAGVDICPSRIDLYPEILDDNSPSKTEESCMELNESKPQHLITNLFAVNLLLKCIVEILTEEVWSGGIYYFDAFKGFSRFQEKESV